MTPLHLSTLGGLRISAHGRPLGKFESDKVRALLVYLAVESHRAHRREYLAGLLWSELSLQKARSNLRQALSNLRTAIGDRDALPPYLHIDRQEIRFNSRSIDELDCSLLERVLERYCTKPAGPNQTLPGSQVLQILAGYGGEFLAHFEISGAPLFEEWVRSKRERIHRLYLQAVDSAGHAYAAAGQQAQAEQLTLTLLTHDPLHEPAHRRLITLYLAQGRTGAAVAQLEQCRTQLAQALGVEPAPETVALLDAIPTTPERPRHDSNPQAPANSPPDFAPDALVHNLETRGPSASRGEARARVPGYTLPCIGREKILQTLLAQVAPRQTETEIRPRLISLVGPGGMGKTRLAAELVVRAAGKSGCTPPYFVPLADVASPQQFWGELAQAMNVQFAEGEEPKAQLLGVLAHMQALLILDNLETVADRGELVTEILAHAPGVQILATTRERLQLSHEYVCNLGGLELPQAEFDGDPAQARQPAIELFVQSARRADPGFVLDDENLRAVCAICRLTEGMPLAIELAAGWARALSCRDIESALRENLNLLTSAYRDLPPRHRSIRAALDGSWQMLPPGLQMLYRRLAVFHGSFEKSAALAITGATEEGLAALLDRSLLRRDGSERYRLHELLRRHAFEKLQAGADYTHMQTEHCIWFSDRLDATSLTAHPTGEWVVDLPNFQAAFRFALQRQDWPRIVILADGLGGIYERLNRHREALEHFLHVLDATDDPSMFSPGDESEREWTRASWQRRLGEAHYCLGQLPAGLRVIQQSLARLDGTGALGATRPAWRGLERGIVREFGQQVYIRVAEALGAAHSIRPAVGGGNGPGGDPQTMSRQARCRYEEAAAAYERLGQLYFFDGKTRHSLYTALRGLNLAQHAGSSPILSRLLANIALAAGLIPLHGIARYYARLAEKVARGLDDPSALVWALELSGLYSLGVGEWGRARAAGQEAVALAAEVGDLRRREECLALLASVAQVQGAWPDAVARWQELAETGRNLGHRQVQAWGMSGEAECLLLQNRPQTALELLTHSLQIHRYDGDRPSQACDHGSLALAYWQLGNEPAALESARTALGLFANCAPTAVTAREGYCAVAQVLVLGWRRARSAEAARDARLAVEQLKAFARVFPVARPRAALWQSVLAETKADPLSRMQAHAFRREGLAAARRLGLQHERYLLEQIPHAFLLSEPIQANPGHDFRHIE